MSEHKKVGIVGSTSKGMATTGKKAPLRFAHFRLWLVCAAGLLLVAATVCTVWLVHHHDARSTHISTEQVMSPSEVHAKASSLFLTGHATAAQQLLDAQIAQAKSSVSEGQLYEQKASLAYSGTDFTEALQFAQRAEHLNPTVNSANLIATSAQALGNNALALQYYKLELQRGGNSMLSTDKLELQLNIKALGG
jgi:hypothetical protein